jgi:hypothetical protein
LDRDLVRQRDYPLLRIGSTDDRTFQ